MNLECTKYGHLNDVWVFNPKGWTRDQILGESASKYEGQSDEDILPTISGYEFSQSKTELSDKKQSFSSFRLYDDAKDGPTIQQALEEGWECTGIDGKWCRKPFLNRYELSQFFIDAWSSNSDRLIRISPRIGPRIQQLRPPF